jgi:uncharacterized membrane protein YgcG
MKKSAALLLVLALFATPAIAELYKWVGKDGKITYSDTPPPADAKKVEKKRLNDRVSEGDGLAFATQDAMRKFPVFLFATDCGEPCDKGKALLAKRGVPYTAKNPEKNIMDGKDLKKLVGALEVPALQVGKNGIKGYNEPAWNAALDAAGYPKSAAPLKANAIKESKDTNATDAKPKSRKEEIGGQNQAAGAGGGAGGGGGNNGGGGNAKDLNPAFTNKADPNARSGPYHEPDLPPSATKNDHGPQPELTQKQIDEMEGIKR